MPVSYVCYTIYKIPSPFIKNGYHITVDMERESQCDIKQSIIWSMGLAPAISSHTTCDIPLSHHHIANVIHKCTEVLYLYNFVWYLETPMQIDLSDLDLVQVLAAEALFLFEQMRQNGFYTAWWLYRHNHSGPLEMLVEVCMGR